ncbi:MAG: PAS domain S-box protein [Planctomycetia bacterium]|nr:PAS domain S-box protein [Planctomycetia bacterium]
MDLKGPVEHERERLRALQVDSEVRAVAESSSDNIMLLDPERRIRYVNWTVPDLTPEGVIGTIVESLVPEEFRPELQRCFARVAASRRPDRYETSYVAATGEVSYWESRVSPVLRQDRLVGFSVISSNVTERRQAAADRDLLFNLSLDLLCIAGADGRFRRVNPAFERVLGRSAEELTSRPFLDFVHPDDREATRAAFSRLLGGAELYDFENRYSRKDGTWRILSWRAATDSSRQVVHAIARDVTEYKLLQQELVQAQKMEAIGRLAGGIAHDFNNMLLAIQGNAEFAKREGDAERRREFLDQVQAAAKRSADLTRQLLAFGRRQPLKAVPLNLNDLLGEFLKLVRRVLPESVEMEFQPGAGLDFVEADPGQLERVVMNLCVNARDAMPDGGRLVIRTENTMVEAGSSSGAAEAGSVRYVTLVVSDVGHGMPPDVKSRIFEPFFSTKQQGAGTGLGLATVYGVVKQHGGFIQVESQPGQGSTFRISLPSVMRPSVCLTRDAEAGAPRGGETILVAEDEPLVRGVAVALLADAGYAVLEARDGQEALEEFRRHGSRISLLLMDVVMPCLGGVDAARLIREIAPRLPILLTSGYNTERADLAGVDYLDKPYQADVLLRRIRAMIDAVRR